MVGVIITCSYEDRILPYLLQPSVEQELWITGFDGSCTVNPELAAALLGIVLPTSCIVVPDAPVSALKEFAQLLNFGRYLNIKYQNISETMVFT